MRLADFIEHRISDIVTEWEGFALTLWPASRRVTPLVLRDHAEDMLRAIALDLRTDQSRQQQRDKAWGRGDSAADGGTPFTAAQLHGALRATAGISIQQLISEFRAMRASVLCLYADEAEPGTHTILDIGRFNEAIDQAIAESAEVFQQRVEHWRQLFLGVIQHDLRGPLQAVMSSGQLLGTLPHGAERSRVAAGLMNSVNRMTTLLDELMDYNRVTLHLGLPVHREDVDLATACREEVDLRRHAYPAHRIDWIVSGPTRGRWDASRVRQALGNLIANAAKHGDPTGPIEVEFSGLPDEVQLVVRNQGPAIDPDRIPGLFDPLRGAADPARDDRTHLGLGLFVVREIARAHGGEVFVASDPTGTRFRMVLPRG